MSHRKDSFDRWPARCRDVCRRDWRGAVRAAHRAVTGFAVLAIAYGCSTTPWQPAPDHHVVRSGDTLSTIAWRHGKRVDDLARWNRLGDGSLIYPGQVLRLHPPPNRGPATASTPSRPLPDLPQDPPPRWSWPTAGRVAVPFGGRPGSGTGVLLAGEGGQAINAAAAGRVVYAGGGLSGYGRLIIVKHNETFLSAYGHNASLLVREGQAVRRGQKIATMGEGPGRAPRLHFEIRRNGKPVNPRQYLPAR